MEVIVPTGKAVRVLKARGVNARALNESEIQEMLDHAATMIETKGFRFRGESAGITLSQALINAAKAFWSTHIVDEQAAFVPILVNALVRRIPHNYSDRYISAEMWLVDWFNQPQRTVADILQFLRSPEKAPA